MGQRFNYNVVKKNLHLIHFCSQDAGERRRLVPRLFRTRFFDRNTLAIDQKTLPLLARF